MRLTGVLATHYHPDHVGGDMMGYRHRGRQPPARAGARSRSTCRPTRHPGSQRTTGVGEPELVTHRFRGRRSWLAAIGVELIHTPGHTPGSQCFLVDGRLVAGDTLFLEGCGRTDLPGGDPAEMYRCLTERLGRIPDDTVLFPGHLYSAEPCATMGETRRWNYVLAPKTEAEWLAVFSR